MECIQSSNQQQRYQLDSQKSRERSSDEIGLDTLREPYFHERSRLDPAPSTERPFANEDENHPRHLIEPQDFYSGVPFYHAETDLYSMDLDPDIASEFDTFRRVKYNEGGELHGVVPTAACNIVAESDKEKYLDFTSNLCFGMLCDVKVQLDDNLNAESLNFSELITGSQLYLVLSLSFHENYCLFKTKEGHNFAVLNNNDFRSISSLLSLQELKLEALVSLNNWRQGASESEGSRKRHLDLDINVFGPVNILDKVAKELSQARLFLQPPRQFTTTLPYQNPQYLYLPGVLQHPVDSPHVTTGSRSSNSGILDLSRKEDLLNQEEFPELDLVLDQLPGHEYLREIEADFRIKTTLLSHQKEAIDFVIKRETLTSPTSTSLWGNNFSIKCYDVYQHVITGAKSPAPNDFPGGILADDMGLGKSLTMLSAIVGSLGRATKHAISSGSDHTVLAISTLIIVPSVSLLENWIEEINKHLVRGAITYYKYHGQDRPESPLALVHYDVVLTTYGTLAADFNRSRAILKRIKWFRVILDEAHVIRNSSTKQFQAVNRLQAHIKWCLTGTPIQNTLADLGALVTFLGVPLLKETPVFRKYIESSIRVSKGNLKSDFKNLHLLLGSICLRRTKSILPLFGLTSQTRCPQLSMKEREKYRHLEIRCRDAIDAAVSGHKTKQAHQSVIESLLALRLFCNNGPERNTHGKSLLLEDPEESLSLLQQSGDTACNYCACDILSMSGVGNPDHVQLTRCQRLICAECVTQYHQDLMRFQASGKSSCPICFDSECIEGAAAGNNLDDENSSVIGVDRKIYPSKLMTLLKDIETNNLQEKSIVFSCWKRTLDITGHLFTKNGIEYIRIDGSLSPGKRRAAMLEFQNNSRVGVLFMTLGTGAVGLNNLSIASRIYLLEPQWNPFVENQAIGRIFRLGQTKPVHVVRYVVGNTIEQHVKTRQLKKLHLASGGFDKKDSARRNQDLQQLKAFLSPSSVA